MELSTIEQVINLIDKNKRILLLTHARSDADGLGAMLSMNTVLKEMGKDVVAATSDPTPENLAFLPNMNIVENSLSGTKDFVITLDTTQTQASKIRYNVEEGKVNIVVTPKEGMFNKDNISVIEGAANFDLIIVFDTGNLEHLGKIYEQNTEMFFEVPVINIDHHASNTNFGKVNLVDITAASATEVTFGLLKEMEKKYSKKLVTPDIATLLLAGVITDTGSFQHANTSPKSMEVAAELLDLGGRQQEIIKNIYKTKKLSTLKLWGIVLSKVQVDPVYRMVWSTVSKDDFVESGADSEETGTIIDDLLNNAPGAEVIFLIKENSKEGYTSVSMRSTSDSIDVGKLCTELGGGGHIRAAGAKIQGGRTFDEVTNMIIDKVRQFQAERLNIHPEDLNPVTPVETLQPKTPDQPQTGSQSLISSIPQEPQPEKPTKETPLEFKAPPKPEKSPKKEIPKRESRKPKNKNQNNKKS